MAEGEELHVIELDQGDGWTRVRRMMSGSTIEEGFVPTSYIESTLYAQVVTQNEFTRLNLTNSDFRFFFDPSSVDHIYVNNV